MRLTIYIQPPSALPNEGEVQGTPYRSAPATEGAPLELIRPVDFKVDHTHSYQFGKSLKFDFEIAINSIRIPEGLVRKSVFYIATTQFEVEFVGHTNRFLDWTPSKVITGKSHFETKRSAQQEVKTTAIPFLRLSHRPGAGRLDTVGMDVKDAELIATRQSAGQIIWTYAFPSVEHPIRNFAEGNFAFYVIADFKVPAKGCIRVNNIEQLFFDSQRRCVGKTKSAVMHAKLVAKGYGWPKNRNGEKRFQYEVGYE